MSASHPLPSTRREEPLAPVFELGWRASRTGIVLGLFFALVSHAAAFALPLAMLLSMRRYVDGLREDLHDYFTTQYDVDVVEEKEKEKEEEPPIEEEEEPVVQPEPQPVDVQKPIDDPYEDDEPAPAPAEASDALTQDEPVNMTDDSWTIVDKDGSTNTGSGYASKKGTSKKPVRNRRARDDGKPGGRGTGPARATAPKVDRSRPPKPLTGTFWNCPFPPQADLEQVDKAAVLIAVTVAADGTPKGVKVLNDPGYGFGQMAKRCAMAERWSPALDADGRAIATTAQVNMHFTR